MDLQIHEFKKVLKAGWPELDQKHWDDAFGIDIIERINLQKTDRASVKIIFLFFKKISKISKILKILKISKILKILKIN